MKQKILISLFFCTVLIIKAQDTGENTWISQVRMEDTGIGSDSTGYYTRVVVELNMEVLTGSFTLTMMIGSVPGGNDIYYNTVRYDGAVFTGTNPSHSMDGNIARFEMGQYIIPDENFYADAIVE